MRLLVRWLILTAALILAVIIVPGLEYVPPWQKFFLASLVLAALNLLAHPVLWVVKLVTLPISCLTLGLWTLFLTLFANTLIFYFVGTLRWGWGFNEHTGFGGRVFAALLGALIVSIVNSILNGMYALSKQRQTGTAG